MTDGRDVGLVVEPAVGDACAAARAWSRLDVDVLGRPLSEWRRVTRRELGLPDEGVVVMTGHQAQVWHAGILSKWFVAERCAEALGGAAAQVVVDQDVNDAALVSYPCVRGGSLAVAALAATPARRVGPTAMQSTVRLAAPTNPPVDEARVGVERIVAAIDREASAPSVAEQVVRANDALLRPFVAPFARVFASRMLATDLGNALVSEMSRNPARCIAAYATALATDPHVARPLDAERPELPLWYLRADGRDRVYRWPSATLATGASYAPRAFLMTAFARLALCDLFVHGVGGKRYERVTEAWIRGWLGVELAPMAVATATLRLPLERFVDDAPTATIGDLRRLRADPDADGPVRSPSPAKLAFIDRIAALPRRSPERRATYRALLGHLDARRTARAADIERVTALVASSRDRVELAAIASSRTWPWPLHADDRVVALRETIRRQP